MSTERNAASRVRARLARELPYHLMIVPGVVFVVILCYIPMLGILIAFEDYNFRLGFFHSPWVGLYFFKAFFKDFTLPNTLLNSVALGSLTIATGFTLSILLALLLNELANIRFKRTVQTVTYLPHFVSWVVISVIIMSFLSPTDGLVNQLMLSLGLIEEPIFFLGKPGYYWWIVVISNIWKETGWSAIIFISAIAGIDQAIIESAIVDGAGRFRRMWYVTLPSIKTTIAILLVLNVGGILGVGFDQALLLGNPLISERSNVLSYYVYVTGLKNGDYAYATALNLITAMFAASFMVIGNTISRKTTGKGVY